MCCINTVYKLNRNIKYIIYFIIAFIFLGMKIPKIQKSKNPKIQDFQRDARLSFGFLDFWIFGFLDFWIFGFLDFWISRFLDFWILASTN